MNKEEKEGKKEERVKPSGESLKEISLQKINCNYCQGLLAKVIYKLCILFKFLAVFFDNFIEDLKQLGIIVC